MHQLFIRLFTVIFKYAVTHRDGLSGNTHGKIPTTENAESQERAPDRATVFKACARRAIGQFLNKLTKSLWRKSLALTRKVTYFDSVLQTTRIE